MSTAVPHPVRPTTEPDDSPHSLADVQRRQQAVCNQTTDEPDDGYETDIATDVVAPCCCLVQTDVFRSPDCPSIVDRTEAPFSFSGCPFCTFVDNVGRRCATGAVEPEWLMPVAKRPVVRLLSV